MALGDEQNPLKYLSSSLETSGINYSNFLIRIMDYLFDFNRCDTTGKAWQMSECPIH
jgi:hypothetical protein